MWQMITLDFFPLMGVLTISIQNLTQITSAAQAPVLKNCLHGMAWGKLAIVRKNCFIIMSNELMHLGERFAFGQLPIKRRCGRNYWMLALIGLVLIS